VYAPIVAKKAGLIRYIFLYDSFYDSFFKEFGFTVLKENDAASLSFIGTLVVNPKDFDCLNKAHNLGYKFEEFPILVAGVAYKLEYSENSHVQLHITEGRYLSVCYFH
jgi:hypothetical protein